MKISVVQFVCTLIYLFNHSKRVMYFYDYGQININNFRWLSLMAKPYLLKRVQTYLHLFDKENKKIGVGKPIKDSFMYFAPNLYRSTFYDQSL